MTTFEQKMKEFDKEFMMFDSETKENIDHIHGLIPTHKTIKDIKSFLKSTALALIEEDIKVVEGMIREIGERTHCKTCDGHIAAGECDCIGRNKAIKDILSHLNQKKELIEKMK